MAVISSPGLSPGERRGSVGQHTSQNRRHRWLPEFEAEALEEFRWLGETAPLSRIGDGQGCRACLAAVPVECTGRRSPWLAHGVEQAKYDIALPGNRVPLMAAISSPERTPGAIGDRALHDLTNEWPHLQSRH